MSRVFFWAYPLLVVAHPLLDVAQPLLDAAHSLLDVVHLLFNAAHPLLDAAHPLLDIAYPLLDILGICTFSRLTLLSKCQCLYPQPTQSPIRNQSHGLRHGEILKHVHCP